MASNLSATAFQRTPPTESKPEKVLFVDDELEQCRLISDYLRIHGYQVSLADNAQLALHKAKQGVYSVIILDVNLADLAGRDGSNLLAAMKKLHPSTPIILYTGMSQEDAEVADMLKSGALKHVSKGETLDSLLKAVQESTRQTTNN